MLLTSKDEGLGASRPRDETRSSWPKLVLSILDSAGSSGRIGDALTKAAREATAADGVALVRWIRGHARILHQDGDVGSLPRKRPAEGTGILGSRPIATVRAGSDTYLVARWKAGTKGRLRQRAELDTLRALAGVAAGAATAHREALAALFEVATKIIASRDLDEVLLEVANATARILRAEIAGIFLIDPSSGTLLMRCPVGHRTVDTARLRVASGQGLAGKVLEVGRPQKLDDYATAAGISKDFLSIAKEEGTQSAMGAPMQVQGRTEGVVCVWRRRRSIFTDEDVRVLSALAHLAAVAVERAKLYEAQRESSEALSNVHHELELRYQAAEQALAIHRELTQIAVEGADVGAAIRAVRRLTGGRVALVGDEQTILGESPDGAGSEALALMPREEHWGPGAESTRIIEGGRKHWLLVAPVRATGVGFGNLCLVLATQPGQGEIVAAEQAATVCALLLAREEAAVDTARRLQSEFMWDLLEGRIPDAAEGLVRAKHLGHTLELPARVVVVAFHGLEQLARAEAWPPEHLERVRGRLARAVLSSLEEAADCRVVSARRADLLAAIVPVGRAQSADDARKLGEAALSSTSMEGVQLTAGVSHGVRTMTGFNEAYRQAQFALSASSVDSHSAVVFDDLGVVQFLLAPALRSDLDSFTDRILGPLVEYDRMHRADLVRSLDTYLDCDCSLQRSAEHLNVHHKTMRYRLQRIHEITGLTLQKQEDRFNAQLALKILHLGRDVRRA